MNVVVVFRLKTLHMNRLQNKKKAKDAKVKPISVLKDDDVSAPPSPTLTLSINHFEQIHPKDEFELLRTSPNDKVSRFNPVFK